MAEKAKGTKMELKVDLQCYKCYKKVKKLLCKYPEIQDQEYDEKNNKVTIRVVGCSPEEIRDKLYCKGRKCINSIEILKPKDPPPATKPKDPPPPTKPKDPPPPPPFCPPIDCLFQFRFCCPNCCKGDCKGPCYNPCYCHGKQDRHCGSQCGRPVCDDLCGGGACRGQCCGGGCGGQCGGGRCGSRCGGGGCGGQCGSRCKGSYCEENLQGCTIM